MAILESIDHPGQSQVLATRHLVGRSKVCMTSIDDRQISGEHAVLEWKGNCWELRDLGSRNGTFVDDRRLEAGERHTLKSGEVLRFAKSSWRLRDDGPPTAMAVALDESAPNVVSARDGMLSLPVDAESPELCIYQGSDGEWLAEYADRQDRIGDQDVVVVAGTSYRVYLPQAMEGTIGVDDTPVLHVLTLRFRVSADEEYVELIVEHQGQKWELGSRSHFYPLLVLARARVRDREEGVAVSARGWVYQDELLEMLQYSGNRLHTEIYRGRR
ncbi:MAG: FHA domain-containing protein, partial [Myxococcales bacterium]|nr:FHA domain-containing protein [Myxococcales bacterium]